MCQNAAQGSVLNPFCSKPCSHSRCLSKRCGPMLIHHPLHCHQIIYQRSDKDLCRMFIFFSLSSYTQTSLSIKTKIYPKKYLIFVLLVPTSFLSPLAFLSLLNVVKNRLHFFTMPDCPTLQSCSWTLSILGD